MVDNLEPILVEFVLASKQNPYTRRKDYTYKFANLE